MIRAFPLMLLLLAAACSEAQMCRNAALSPLRGLERQIQEAEANIARGYSLTAVPGRREYSAMWCPVYTDKDGNTRRVPGRCASPFPPDPDYIQRPVNIEAEKAKLASLVDQHRRLKPDVDARLAACPAG